MPITDQLLDQLLADCKSQKERGGCAAFAPVPFDHYMALPAPFFIVAKAILSGIKVR